MKRSALLSLADAGLAAVVDGVRREPSPGHVWAGGGAPLPKVRDPEVVVVLDARGFPSEGESSLSRAVVDLYRRGARRFLVANSRGQRFIGCGLGPDSHGVRIDVYGSSGDYLASGIDGAEIVVHGSAQDQVAQIMKDGLLVVHGDVGQTFMYAAKGGDVFVLGGAVYVRDPHGTLTDDQLNGGELADLGPEDWALIRPCLKANERVFGIPLERLLAVHGRAERPERVYRKIRPARHRALSPEEAWVKREA
jgi:hypothetical protein